MDKDRKPAGSKPCPICGKPAVDRHRPFCSARCADIDLGRWFRESYRIPSIEPAPDAAEPSPAAESDDDRREH
jgi:endogenous inhibitor of DNA gyrase (YacG/DUF329 family)